MSEVNVMCRTINEGRAKGRRIEKETTNKEKSKLEGGDEKKGEGRKG